MRDGVDRTLPERPGPLERNVLACMRRLDLGGKGTLLLVGVSGGPDSVCLLHVLCRLRDALDLSLHVAHLDHGLRGAESDGDREYVVTLCGKLGVPVTAEKTDLLNARPPHSSHEEAAREARYDFFARVAGGIGAGAVAVGHTADDHIETVLLHLVRGTGTRGLAGLAQDAEWRGAGRLRVVRPLLGLRRSETEAYCRRFRLWPRTDASNLSLVPLRNRVRHELLPLLRRYNPGFDEVIMRAARTARADMEALELWADEVWPRVARVDGGAVRLDRDEMCTCPPGLRRALLRRALEEVAGGPRDIEACHIDALMEALEKPAGKRFSLARGLTARAGYGDLVLGAAERPPIPPLEGEHGMAVPGKTQVCGWAVTADLLPPEGAGSLLSVPGPGVAFFDYDVIGPILFVRGRRPGDRLMPLGMSSLKKLQDFMVDARIPRRWRERVPLVCSPHLVAWVVGWRIDDRVRVTANTRRVLRVRFDLTGAKDDWYINMASPSSTSTGQRYSE